MKNSTLKKLLLLLFIIPVFAFTSINWITIELDEKVSVDFPLEPTQQDLSGNTMWVADINPDSRCMTMLMDFGKMGLDSAQMAKDISRPEAFDEFKDGMLGQMKGSSLISEKTTTTLGYKTFELVVDMGKKDTSALNVMHTRAIFINAKMYALYFYEKNGKPQDDSRNRFFNSLKIK